MSSRELNLPRIDPALPATLGGFLEEAADKHGSREAIALYDRLKAGKRVSWSYEDLLNHARTVGKALIAAGISKGTRVGIHMANRPEFIAAFFGTALAGGVPVTLSTFLTAQELATQLEIADVSILLTQKSVGTRNLFEEVNGLFSSPQKNDIHDDRFPFLRRIVVLGRDKTAPGILGWGAFLQSGNVISDRFLAACGSHVKGSDVGVIIFTSGTTTRPKGVIHLHQTVTRQYRWQSHIYGRTRETRIWSPFPLFWSAGLVSVLGSTLAAGGCWVGQEIFEPGAALKLMERERVTEPYGFPTHTAALAGHPDWLKTDLSSLRCVRGNNEFDGHPKTDPDPDWNMIVAYGMSETCTSVTSHLSTTPISEQAKNFGLPLPGVELRIIDLDSGVPLSGREEGEICVRSPMLMEHYVGMARFECIDKDGFFHTGDTGFVDNQGYLHWTGRIKNIVKTGGANVATGEVEAAANAIDGVKLCRVIGMPDKRLGEMIVLCAVREEGSAITEDEVRNVLRGKLAAYKVPKRVLFFDIADYPLTSSGKVKDWELRNLISHHI